MTDSTPDSLTDTHTLNNGVPIPALGLGTWQATADDGARAVREALEIGYRHIDTAAIYGNEADVACGLAESGVPRDDVFITTKLWNDSHDPAKAHAAFDESRRKLGTDYIDLYLIHWPCGMNFMPAWGALEALLADGKARAIGVSNFMRPHLDLVLREGDVVPAVNQIECHPWLVQPNLHDFTAEHGIRTEAWSPIMQGRFGEVEAAGPIAARHGKSVAQVLIRWGLQRGLVSIPKSTTPARIRSNAEVFDFTLSDDEMAALTDSDRGERLGPDPMGFTVGA